MPEAITTGTRWYVCFYPNYWGVGTTPDEAKKKARQAHGRGNEWYIKLLPEGVEKPYVDQMGCICWTWPKDWTDEQKSEANKAGTEVVQASRVTAARMRKQEERLRKREAAQATA